MRKLLATLSVLFAVGFVFAAPASAPDPVIGSITAFFSPAMGALMADMVPSEMRGRVMAAIGRGSIMIGGASGGIGGPGMGFLVTGPLMVASACGGMLYAWGPAIPFLFVLGATVIALVLALVYLHEPKQAEV